MREKNRGACQFVKSIAEAKAPDIVNRYILDTPAAAAGIATDQVREEIGAAMHKAQAQVILGRIRYCIRASVRRQRAASSHHQGWSWPTMRGD